MLGNRFSFLFIFHVWWWWPPVCGLITRLAWASWLETRDNLIFSKPTSQIPGLKDNLLLVALKMDYFSFVILWSWRRALIQSLTFGHFLQNLEIGTINLPLIIVPPTQDDTFLEAPLSAAPDPWFLLPYFELKKQEQSLGLLGLKQPLSTQQSSHYHWAQMRKSANLLIKAPKLCKMKTENSLYTQGRVSWFPSACFSLTQPVIARGIGMSCID